MYDFIKRLCDLIFSLLGVVCFSWLFLFLVILVFMSTKENPFFLQKRIGRDEVVFDVFKFKTMVNQKSNWFLNLLRRTSLDELPQLFNVIRGEMSLVGPRPLLPEYLELYSLEQRKRHIVLPGVTGLTQITGANDLSWKQRLELDVLYVEKRSLFLDFRILIETFVLFKFLKKGSSASSEKFTGN